jgi:hypothetical protein
MLKRLTALFAILVLLLPSSLAAVVLSQAQPCMSQDTSSSCCSGCCCSHSEQDQDEQGPLLESECCCEFQAPSAPQEQPAQARYSAEQNLGIAAYLPYDKGFTLLDHGYPSAPPALVKAPPRAPPQPLFLYFQSFLI